MHEARQPVATHLDHRYLSTYIKAVFAFLNELMNYDLKREKWVLPPITQQSNGLNHQQSITYISQIKVGLSSAFEWLALPLIVKHLCEVLSFAARVRGGLMVWETQPWHECKNN